MRDIWLWYRVEREEQYKSSAYIRPARGIYGTVMVFGDFLTNCQTDTGTGVF
jgi:hypothetical protein